MTRDQAPPKPVPADDDARTQQAKRVVEEYATMLREILGKLRRWFN